MAHYVPVIEIWIFCPQFFTKKNCDWLTSNKINIQIGSKNGSRNQSRINNDSKTSDLKDLSIESLKKDSLAESQRSPRDDESPEARALRKEMS